MLLAIWWSGDLSGALRPGCGKDAAAMETETLVFMSSPGTVTREMKMVVLDTRAGSDQVI